MMTGSKVYRSNQNSFLLLKYSSNGEYKNNIKQVATERIIPDEIVCIVFEFAIFVILLPKLSTSIHYDVEHNLKFIIL